MPSKKYKIEYQSAAIQRDFDQYFSKRKDITPYRVEFEADVTENPYKHKSNPKKIKALKGRDYYGLYRWGKSNTRIVYYPDENTATIFPLEVGSATDISYKKKSRK